MSLSLLFIINIIITTEMLFLGRPFEKGLQ